MLHIAICDDSLPQTEVLAAMLKRILKDKPYDLQVCHTADELIATANTAQPDIVLTDIALGADSGIRAARVLKEQAPHTQIIFLSAYPSFAADIYAVDHAYFLLKPIQQDKFSAAMERAMETIRTLRDAKLALTVSGGGIWVFDVADLIYFERTYRTTSIYSQSGNYKTMAKLTELEELLPQNVFSRPHNSFLVHLGHVRSVERFSVLLDNGATVPVSNQRRAAFHMALAAFL